MTNSGKQRKNCPSQLHLQTDTLDSSTPLRCAQNDSDRVAFSSRESGSIVSTYPCQPVEGEGVCIRELTGDDVDEYRRLRLRALREHPDAFGSSYEAELAVPIEAVAERLRRNAESKDSFTLGAYRGEALVGMVGFYQESREKTRHRGTICGMYVPSEEQGQGTGRALLTRAIELARGMAGLEQLQLAVVSRNRRAKDLYASFGFETYGVEPRALFVNGEYLDEEHMVLLLSPSPQPSPVEGEGVSAARSPSPQPSPVEGEGVTDA